MLNSSSSVVCRKHKGKAKSSELDPDPAFFCSISCGHDDEVKICDAARATSAAWTYFSIMKIGSGFFADGGVEYNNPSFAILDHYTVDAETRRIRDGYHYPSRKPAPPIPTHQGVDFSRCRIVNIGTGSKTEGTPPRKREKFAALIPESILFGLFMKRTLTEIATASERAAGQIRTMAQVEKGDLIFNRLSATNGVCWIKLDKYRKLDEITTLTQDWLRQSEISDYMSGLARDIAKEYREAHPSADTETAP